MKLVELLNKIEDEFPLNLQEEWDCSGLLIEVDDISKVLVCLDITNEIKDYAIKNRVDLIISHHPLIFQDYCRNDEYIRMIFQELYANKIALYSMHTNYDNNDNGMNTSFIKEIGYTPFKEESMLVGFNSDEYLFDNLKNYLSVPFRIYNKKDNYQKVGVILGSGGFILDEIINKKYDALISSEFKHHEILKAVNYDISLIDVSHQAEVIFVDQIEKFLKNMDLKIEIDTYIYEYSIDNIK